MSDVVDRVARAICLKWRDQEAPPEDRNDSGWEDWRPEARAAIEAMREPTEEMQLALNGYACCAGYIPEGWSAAIDVALKEAENV